jgi:hypothetical protein
MIGYSLSRSRIRVAPRLAHWKLPFATGRKGCAPWKGGVFQWVKGPPGKCSSRKLPEQLWR